MQSNYELNVNPTIITASFNKNYNNKSYYQSNTSDIPQVIFDIEVMDEIPAQISLKCILVVYTAEKRQNVPIDAYCGH